MLYDAHVRNSLLFHKAKEIIFIIVQTISPFGKPSKRAFLLPLKFK
ncbi:MAG: hypothetical protein RL494_37 [Bacteroidota bacterium]|jgi:hypothetical protein